MSEAVVGPIVTIAMGILAIAFLSVLLSKNAQTASVLSAFGNMFTNMLSGATAPVTGNAGTPNTSAIMSGGTFGGLGGFGMPGLN